MRHLIFLTIFLLFLSCGGDNPRIKPTDKPDPNKNEEKITIPDDLSSIATPLVKGGSFSDNVSFIYKGDNKIQGDIEDGAIDDEVSASSVNQV